MVLLKPVPDLSLLSFSVSQDKVFEKGQRIIKGSDRNALEFALQIKEKEGWEIEVVMLGNRENEKLLREAIALGADRANLILDSFEVNSLSGSWAIETVLKKTGPFALILLGGKMEKTPESQMEYRLAQAFHFPLAANLTFSKLERGIVYGTDDESKEIQISTPAVLSIKKDSNAPRIPNAIKIMKASKATVTRWDLKEEFQAVDHLRAEKSIRSYLNRSL